MYFSYRLPKISSHKASCFLFPFYPRLFYPGFFYPGFFIRNLLSGIFYPGFFSRFFYPGFLSGIGNKRSQLAIDYSSFEHHCLNCPRFYLFSNIYFTILLISQYIILLTFTFLGVIDSIMCSN